MVDTNTRRVIATRVLSTADGREVIASLFEPIPKGEVWECAFSIVGPDIDIEGAVGGVDSMQAITLGVEGIRVHLGRVAESLSWMYGEDGYLGFPRFYPAGFGVEVEARLVKLVNDEIGRLVAEKARARGDKWPPDHLPPDKS